jgi:hypothetical protein
MGAVGLRFNPPWPLLREAYGGRESHGGPASRGLCLTHRRTAPNTVTMMLDLSAFVNGYFDRCMAVL